MNHSLVPPARILPRDPELLDRRARALASALAEAEAAVPEDVLSLVLFRLRDMACALEMRAVARAVSRLDRVVSVPIASGGERFVAFVDERPFPVVDLMLATSGLPRPLEKLVLAPALVLAFENGPVAVAVEGPLELAEEPVVELASTAPRSDPAAPRIRGRLPSGASLFDADWMLSWAASAVGA